MHNPIVDGFEAILYHVLGSGTVQQRNDAGPFLSMLLDELKDDKVFLGCPFAFFDVAVEVILPTLAALFWSFEVESPGLDVEVFCDFVPLTLFEVTRIKKKILVSFPK